MGFQAWRKPRGEFLFCNIIFGGTLVANVHFEVWVLSLRDVFFRKTFVLKVWTFSFAEFFGNVRLESLECDF